MSLKQKTFKGVVWSGSEKLGIQGIQFILGIILARLLSPKDFGLLGLLTIFIALAQTFIDSGFSVGLVRKADADDHDFSTVFWFNIFVALLSYIALFIGAPYIADFYHQPILTILTRVVTLSLIINSFGAIQTTILTKKIDFKTMAKVRLFAVTIGGIVGIIMALSGYGVWSLVIKTLVQAVFMNLGFWIGSKWRPAFLFSLKAFLGIFSFGSKLLVSAIFTTITGNLYSLVIGKYFSVQDLGYYTRAKQFTDLPVQSIQGVSMSVLFPVLSQLQDNDEKLREGYTRFLRMITFVLFPVMAMLALTAEPIIHILLTDKWLPVVPLLQILVFIGAMIPLHSINVNVLIVKGRSDLVLTLDIIKNVLLFLTIFITFHWGIFALLWGMLAQSLTVYIIHAYYSNKVMKYSILEQLGDIKESFIVTGVMAALVYAGGKLFHNSYLVLSIEFLIGLASYYLINTLTRNRELIEIRGYMGQILAKFKKKETATLEE